TNRVLEVRQETAYASVVAMTNDIAGKALQTSRLLIKAGQESLTVGETENVGALTALSSGGTLSLENWNASETLTVNAAIPNNGAASGLALFLAAGGIMSLTSQLLPRSWVELFDVTRLFEGSKRHQLGMALVASVLAPFAEEVAFRGYVLSALRTRLPAGAAIVGSAVLFASMHLDPVRFPAVLFLGLFLGWFAWRSGSIWPAVVAHGVNNGLGSAIAVASETDAGEGSLAASLVILALGLAALAPLAVAWVRATPEPPASSSEILRRDANDPSTRFRFAGVPAGWRALAALGVLLYLALGVLRYLQDGRR
ncbi:MAG: CPBP family intramembrane glutamic endopeptidase, partial [Deltaproteobacteria bacterium]